MKTRPASGLGQRNTCIHWPKPLNYVVASIDVRKAFDIAWRDAVLLKLIEMGVAGCTWSVIASRFTGTTARAVVNGFASSPWTEIAGVRQTSVLGPLLLCADDVVVLADSVVHLQRAWRAVGAWGTQSALALTKLLLWFLALGGLVSIFPCKELPSGACRTHTWA